jgi:hypothetical protein
VRLISDEEKKDDEMMTMEKKKDDADAGHENRCKFGTRYVQSTSYAMVYAPDGDA